MPPPTRPEPPGAGTQKQWRGKPLEVKFYLMNDCNDINPLPHPPVTPHPVLWCRTSSHHHHEVLYYNHTPLGEDNLDTCNKTWLSDGITMSLHVMETLTFLTPASLWRSLSLSLIVHMMITSVSGTRHALLLMSTHDSC